MLPTFSQMRPTTPMNRSTNHRTKPTRNSAAAAAPPTGVSHQTGVFRSDLPEKFRLVPSALQSLIDNVDRDLTFAIEVESGIQRDAVGNYDEVRGRVAVYPTLVRMLPRKL